MNGAKIGMELISPGLAPIVTASFTTRKVAQKMEASFNGYIYIKTSCGDIEIGPVSFTDKITVPDIKNIIRKAIIARDCDSICTEEVIEIVVFFENDDFVGMCCPKVESVWPREFGYMHFINRIIDSKRKKGGEK